jgi:hypothetical protein
MFVDYQGILLRHNFLIDEEHTAGALGTTCVSSGPYNVRVSLSQNATVMRGTPIINNHYRGTYDERTTRAGVARTHGSTHAYVRSTHVPRPCNAIAGTVWYETQAHGVQRKAQGKHINPTQPNPFVQPCRLAYRGNTLTQPNPFVQPCRLADRGNTSTQLLPW